MKNIVVKDRMSCYCGVLMFFILLCFCIFSILFLEMINCKGWCIGG